MYRNIARTIFYFEFQEFYTGESSRGLIVPKVRIFEIFVYIYLSKPSTGKVCSVRFFYYKSL